MAKNIHQQIIDGRGEVTHEGTTKSLAFPDWLAKCKDHLQDTEGLINHLSDEGLLLAFLHEGFKSVRVSWAAHCRPAKGESFDAVTDEHSKLYRPEVQGLPKTTSKSKVVMDTLQMIGLLVKAGYTVEELVTKTPAELDELMSMI